MNRVKPLSQRHQQQLLVYLEHLAVLLNSGLPLSVALNILSAQASERPIKVTFETLRSQLQQGTTLAEAAQQSPYILPRSVVGYLAIGEQTGQLPLALSHAVEESQQLQQQRQAISKALRYPAIVASVAILVSSVLLVWVLPQFSTLFGHQQLPWLTQQLLFCSEWLSHQWPRVAIGAIVTVCLLATLRGRYPNNWQKLVLNLPLVGRWHELARLHQLFLRLSMGLAAGMPALHALSQTRQASHWQRCQQQLTSVAAAVNEGQRWSEAFAVITVEHPRLRIYLETGEQSGAMDNMLKALTRDLVAELKHRIERFTRLAEPLLMLVLGGIIGILLLAMYLPIFNLGQQLT